MNELSHVFTIIASVTFVGIMWYIIFIAPYNQDFDNENE
jgi:hypothetical protein